jgi:hypothetical protein
LAHSFAMPDIEQHSPVIDGETEAKSTEAPGLVTG